MENNLISSLTSGEIKTFYKSEGRVDPESHLRQREITAVYEIVKYSVNTHFLFKVHCAGCIFRRFEIGLGGQILKNHVDWNKKQHRQTALSRLAQNPIKLLVKVPRLSKQEIVKRMVKGGKKQKLVSEKDIETLYVQFIRRFIEKRVRGSFIRGVTCKSF